MSDASSDADALEELGRLLAEAGARPVIRPKRLAPSTLHDAGYHFAIIACAFLMYAEKDTLGRTSMGSALLKMLQFIAARPLLVDDLRAHAKGRSGGNIALWERMPRGYLGDRTHDSVVDYLVATGVLARDGDSLCSGARFHVLVSLAGHIDEEKLFEGERQILETLRSIRVTKTMLEGR